MTAVDPIVPSVRTACPYCGVGCGVLATPDGQGGAAISGDPAHPANLGRLCSKGSALGETLGLEGRLLHPMIRGKTGMQRVDWSDALDHVAHRLKHIIARDGSESIVLSDVGRGTYKKLVIAEGRLTGAVLVGDVTDALWYLALIRSRQPIAGIRADMMFGRALAARVAA